MENNNKKSNNKKSIEKGFVKCVQCNVIVMEHATHGRLCRHCWEYSLLERR